MARNLQLQMQEEEMIQKAIAESLKEVDHNPQHGINMSAKLNINSAEFIYQKPLTSKKKQKSSQIQSQQQKKVYVVKGQ